MISLLGFYYQSETQLSIMYYVSVPGSLGVDPDWINIFNSAVDPDL
jgi:hypothetical protein